jgi:hypothetical protein
LIAASACWISAGGQKGFETQNAESAAARPGR